MSFYEFTWKDQNGQDVSMADYRGKVLLIVNTATGCGFTPQYDALQDLYDQYSSQGFEILDFPCNQFGEQAPGSDEEIHSFCTGRYGITFPQFSKIDVNGDHALPLYHWLTDNTAFEGFGMSPMGVMLSGVLKKLDKDYKKSSSIKWNFTKFLIGRDGTILARFEPTVPMKTVAEAVKAAL